jgi:hypothetical protein
MIRKAYRIGMVAAGLTLMAAAGVPGYNRIITSAQRFQQSYRDLKSTGNSLSAFEKVVFSFVMANGETAQKQVRPPAPNRT